MKRMKMLAVASALAALAMPLRAEPGPIGSWLMNEPLTLWDMGIMKAREHVEYAADRIAKASDLSHSFADVEYDWDTNEIDIWWSIVGTQINTTHETCNRARRAFIARLAGVPAFSTDGHVFEIRMYDWIDDLFSHEGFQLSDRDEKLAEKMSRIIFVRVWVRNEDDDNAIECRARLMTIDAPSRPAPEWPENW